MSILQPIINKEDKELTKVVKEVLSRSQHPDLIPTYSEVISNLDAAGMSVEATFQNLSDLMFNAGNSGTRLRATKLAIDLRKIDRNIEENANQNFTINFNFDSGSSAGIQAIFSPRKL